MKSIVPSLCRSLTNLLWTICFVSIALAVSCAAAQSFNIDIDYPGPFPELGMGVPSPSFGAAADQPGNWTSFGSTTHPVPLLDLTTGEPSSANVQLTSVNGDEVFTLFASNNTGDFALLFNDATNVRSIEDGGQRTYTFRSLIDGLYSIRTYTGRPGGDGGEIQVDVVGSKEGPIISAGPATPNTFTLGTSYVVHTLNVTGGTFDIHVVDFPGPPVGYIAGFQITFVPEPGSVTMLLYTVALLHRRKTTSASVLAK